MGKIPAKTIGSVHRAFSLRDNPEYVSYLEKENSKLRQSIVAVGGLIDSSTVVMTPSQQAKAAGLKSLTQVSAMTGVSLQTLTNWHKNKPRLFAVVVKGCAKFS